MLKHHIKPLLGISVTSILIGGFADNISSDKVANFSLSRGFGRRVDIVKNRKNDLKNAKRWKCTNVDSTNTDNIYIDETAVHTLTLGEDLHKPFQITVESTAEMIDPVIIIRPLKKDKAIFCENNEKTKSETLHTEDPTLDIEEFKQDPIPKGTYHILLGSYSNPIDEYKIIISEVSKD